MNSYSDRLNSAVATARDCQSRITHLLQSGRKGTDPELAALYRQYDAALDDGDAWSAAIRSTDQSRETFAWTPDPNDPTLTPDYQRQFDAYVNRFGRSRGAWAEVERQNMVISSDPDGGYTVPADRRPNLLSVTPAESEIISLVNSFPTSRTEVEWVRVVPNSSSPDIYTSAFVGRMVGEVPTASFTPPTFGMFKISLSKARAEARFSMDLASDSSIDMNSFLSNDGRKNQSLLREQQVLVGDGIGNNLLGVMNNPDIDATADVSGTTADHVSNTAADAGSAPKLLDWFYAVPEQYRRDPSFRVVWNSDTNKRVRKLVGADGNFLWRPGFAGTPNTFEEKPVAISGFLASGGTNGNRVALAGPMNEIQHPINLSRFAVQVLVERYADNDLLAMFIRSRFGVGVGNPRAFRIAVV